MAVEPIRDFTGRAEIRAHRAASPDREGAGSEAGKKPSFADLVKDFSADVNRLQFQAGGAIDRFVTGEATDVHQVMIAVQEAGIALDLMLEIRNRVLEGYQELIRMQV